MNDYIVTITVSDGENTITSDFYVEGFSLEDAVHRLENDLDVCLI